MGTIFKRKDRDKDDWYISYISPGGKRIKKRIGPSKTAAKSSLKKIEVEIAEGRYLDIRKRERIKFEDFVAFYIEHHSKINNARTWQRSEYPYLKSLCAYFRGLCMHDITPIMIERFKREKMALNKASTVNKYLVYLKSLYKKADEWGKFQGISPARNIKPLKVRDRRLRFLSREEKEKLLSSCSGNIKDIVVVALNTGMRRGEILSLKWQDVDFEHGIIYVSDTKNNEPRQLPINREVRDTFLKRRRHRNSPYIFYNRDGSRIHLDVY